MSFHVERKGGEDYGRKNLHITGFGTDISVRKNQVAKAMQGRSSSGDQSRKGLYLQSDFSQEVDDRA